MQDSCSCSCATQLSVRCLSTSLHVRTHIRMSVRTHIRMYVCMCVRMYVAFLYVCMYVRMYACSDACYYFFLSVCLPVYLDLWMLSSRMCVCLPTSICYCSLIYLSRSLLVSLSVCLSGCWSVCLLILLSVSLSACYFLYTHSSADDQDSLIGRSVGWSVGQLVSMIEQNWK